MDGNAISDLASLTADQQRQIRDQILIESSRPLTVAIMGQTGVGKSSLLNALFGISLNVGDIRPCTRIPEPVTVAGTTGHQLVFWDMPGIGESAASDQHYLQMYRQKIIECDIVLWAIHADTRSTLFDASALSAILNRAPENERNVLITKLSFVLTKADLLTPPPWIYLCDDAVGTFVPSKALVQRMAEKASYYQEILIKPHGILNTTTTYMSDGFSIDDPRFEYDDYRITYQGFMSVAALTVTGTVPSGDAQTAAQVQADEAAVNPVGTPSSYVTLLQAKAWAALGGADLLNGFYTAESAYQSAVTAAAGSTSQAQYATGLRELSTSCSKIARATQQASAYFTMPVPARQQLWSRMLALYRQWTTACRRLNAQATPADFKAAGTDATNAVNSRDAMFGWLVRSGVVYRVSG